MALNFWRRKRFSQPSIFIYHNLISEKASKNSLNNLSTFRNTSQRQNAPDCEEFRNTSESKQQRFWKSLSTTIQNMLDKESSNREAKSTKFSRQKLKSDQDESLSKRQAEVKSTAPKWEKTAEHIEKLLAEISDFQNSEQLSTQRTTTIDDLLDVKTTKSEQDDLSKSISNEKNCPQPELSHFPARNELDSKSSYSKEISCNTKKYRKNDSRKFFILSQFNTGDDIQREYDSSKPPLDIQELKTVAAMAKRLSSHSKSRESSHFGTEKPDLL